jgi:hypothetical protein
LYATDASFYQITPIAIVLPLDETDVKIALKWARERQMVLFPGVRAATQQTVVANGFSCRHQIHDFTGVKAKHWVETVRGLPAAQSHPLQQRQ